MRIAVCRTLQILWIFFYLDIFSADSCENIENNTCLEANPNLTGDLESLGQILNVQRDNYENNLGDMIPYK